MTTSVLQQYANDLREATVNLEVAARLESECHEKIKGLNAQLRDAKSALEMAQMARSTADHHRWSLKNRMKECLAEPE